MDNFDNPRSPEQESPSGDLYTSATSVPPVARLSIHLEAEKPNVTYILLGITIALYLLQMASGLLLGFDLPAALGAKANEYILKGQVWRLITPVLLHGGLLHIFFNMYALISIGRDIELYYGHRRYLILYLVAGFAGNVFSFLFTESYSYGASTALFGLIAAEGIFIFQNQKFFRNSRAMLLNIGVIVFINLFIVGSIPNIDNFGHLGGLVGGALFAWFAGPIWGPHGTFPEIVISDTRAKNRTLPVTLGVCGLFILLAAVKFLR
jgi:rhomboid protease GluP